MLCDLLLRQILTRPRHQPQHALRRKAVKHLITPCNLLPALIHPKHEDVFARILPLALLAQPLNHLWPKFRRTRAVHPHRVTAFRIDEVEHLGDAESGEELASPRQVPDEAVFAQRAGELAADGGGTEGVLVIFGENIVQDVGVESAEDVEEGFCSADARRFGRSGHGYWRARGGEW
jgi:hypothetical protein